ncbi:MAG: glycoside hydrolase family 27 protein [Prolixibacteraceae bacterium]
MRKSVIYHIGMFLLVVMFCAALNVNGAEKTVSSTNPEIYTPAPKSQPRINGPVVYGCRPGNPFLYRIPCQGERPITFSVTGMPVEMKLDPKTGIITGKVPAKGEYNLLIKAKNAKGSDTRKLKIIAGDKLSLTPPMGWNHWYVHYNRINDKLMREAADAMLASGMADVGYQYVNIDDCWMNAPATTKYMPDSSRVGPMRDSNGNILPNSHFPDMKGLTDYIHSKGLKTGIYTSPGKTTCCGLAGSWQYEEKDAAQFANWGFDFLKYDWCSYGSIAPKKPSLEEMQKPYFIMGDALKKQSRDMVYNLCQYGMGNVWEWGAKVGGNCWRTAGDLGFELDKIFSVALKNAEHGAYSKPGEWNDPDYLQIGYIGSQKNTQFTMPVPCPIAPEEQYSYMSLWCLMASPLIFSGDMSRLDDFTLNVLCNPEVIEIDQDPLGISGTVIRKSANTFLMVKKLVDGSIAVGLFNHGKQKEEVAASWADLQIKGKNKIRDLWHQKDLGKFDQKFSANVPSLGVVMIRISK